MHLHQLFSGVLLEYRRDITARKLGDRLLTAARRDHNFNARVLSGGLGDADSIEIILDLIEKMDPSPKKKYVLWLAHQYIAGAFLLEDRARVLGVMERYVRFLPQFKRLGKNPDLNSYGFHDLEALLDELSGTDLADGGLDTDRRDVKVLYDGPLGTLAIPLTQAAACDLGRGTKWCTAAREDNQFDHYRDGPLYVWRERDGAKYQFHFASIQFMDARDRPIPRALLVKFRTEHPVLAKLFQREERKLVENPKAACDYAAAVIGGRWPEAEPFIMQDPRCAVAYVSSVIKGRWPEAEPFIMKDPFYAVYYAKRILERPWPEAEPYIRKDAKQWAWYQNDVVKPYGDH